MSQVDDEMAQTDNEMTIVPLQRRNLTPERALLAAMLRSAVDDLKVGWPLCERAERWIDGAPAPFTFAQACHAVGLDASATRSALLRVRP